MGKAALRHTEIFCSSNQAGATQYCCQKHVTKTLEVVYLPHIEKVRHKGRACSFCGKKAFFQFSVL